MGVAKRWLSVLNSRELCEGIFLAVLITAIFGFNTLITVITYVLWSALAVDAFLFLEKRYNTMKWEKTHICIRVEYFCPLCVVLTRSDAYVLRSMDLAESQKLALRELKSYHLARCAINDKAVDTEYDAMSSTSPYFWNRPFGVELAGGELTLSQDDPLNDDMEDFNDQED